MSSGESILSPSLIRLYGRTITEIQLNLGAGAGSTASLQNLGANQFLKQQLDARSAGLARIYGFSFEGHYYDLSKPVIMLVHGTGVLIGTPPSIDEADEAARDWEFAAGLSYWEYDKGDFSLRMDVETGPFERILLDAMLFGGGRSFYGGAEARISGAEVRGAEARISGAEARISGAEARMRGRR
jgi:hypothetical protein